MKKALLVLLLLATAAMRSSCSAQGSPDIIVNTVSSAADVSSLLWGHGIQWWNNGEFFWDPWDTARGIGEIRSDPLAELQAAASSQPSFLRYPGGGEAETNHWRTGVGNFKQIEEGDVERRRKYSEDWNQIPKFGTDEVVAFAEQMSSSMKPILQANWWFFNKPGTSETDHEAGVHEAANWVEYCNCETSTVVSRTCRLHPTQQCGLVAQNWTVLQWADHEDWEPSEFRKGLYPSTDWDAVEWADGTYSWRSFHQAPQGYFGWLRYFFSQERGESSDPGPYNITHWEIGNEVFWSYNDLAPTEQQWVTYRDAYHDSLIKYSEAMKKANDANGQLDSNMVEMNPYGDRLKMGACMDDSVNLSTPAPSASAWDTAILDADSWKSIDYMVIHPYVAPYTDWRYCRDLSDDTVLTVTGPEVTLPTGQYTFRIRAKAVVPGETEEEEDEYPEITACLVYDTDQTITLGACRVYYPSLHPDEQTFTGWEYDGHSENGRHDYVFTANITTERAYKPRITLSSNPGNDSQVQIAFMSYQKSGGDETPFELASGQDQTMAVYAAPIILGNRIAGLKTHAAGVTTQKSIGVACTEYRTLFGWSHKDLDRNLKGTIVAADTIREMIEHDVGMANFFELNAEIAEPGSHRYDWVHRRWNNLGTSLWYDATDAALAPADYFRPAPNRLLELLTHHFGTERLDVSTPNVGSQAEHFHNVQYDNIAVLSDPNKVPYLSAVASGSDWDGGLDRYGKLYVLVINKDWANDRTWTLRFDNINGDPSGVTYHTLKCWDTSVSALNAVNTYESPDCISVRSDSRPSTDFVTDESGSTPPYTGVRTTHTFPANSVTVVEVTVGQPAPVYEVGELFDFPNSQSVGLDGKVVTAVFDPTGTENDRFYVEEPDRTAGIGVIQASPTVTVGQVASVSGTLGTDGNGERVITSPSVGPPTSSTAPAPLGMRNQWLGGNPPGTVAETPKDCFGLYNVGLLVQTWGQVTEIPTDRSYFYIDDGSHLEDSSGNIGVRVDAAAPTGLQEGYWVRVIGISGVRTQGNYYVRTIRPRNGDDIINMYDWAWKPVNFDTAGDRQVALYGIPLFPNPESVFSPADESCDTIELEPHLRRYDARTQTWVTYIECQRDIFGNCLLGEGYALYAPGGSCHRYQYAVAPGDQLVSLPCGSETGDFSFIGNPFAVSKTWANFKVTDGVTLLSLADAISQGWIDHIDGVSLPLGSQTMSSGVGYKIYPKRDNLALIIPE